jgi:peptidyl-prolyl cis-trans isomerase C
MPKAKTHFLALAALAVTVSGLAFASGSSDDVLVESAEVKLTRADYESGLERVPEASRLEFAMSPRRVTMLINNILVTKTLAARARANGLQPDANLPQETPADVDRALAAAQRRALEESAGRDFDARRESLNPAVREKYLLGKDQYRRPEEVRLSAILISAEGRGDSAALALAKATRVKLVTVADFAALARELSDDKASAADGGRLPWASADKMEPALAKAAFALTQVGEISEPVHVGNSYILLRLDERRPARQIPFDEAKELILAKMRVDYIKLRWDEQLAAIRNDPTLKVNQPALDALVTHATFPPHKGSVPNSSLPVPAAAN